MAGTSAWIGGNGQGLTWGSAGFTASNFNSLASGSCAVSSQIDNSTALDELADVSYTLTVGGTTTAASYLVLYLLPLIWDGATYGDGATGGGATLPSGQYQVSAVNVQSGITSGSSVTGIFRKFDMPPGKFVWVIANQLGVALNATASATVEYRTYNENLNR